MYEVKLINKEVETIIHYATSDKSAPHLLSMNIQLFENQSNVFSFVIYKNYPGYDKIIDLFTKVKVTDTTKSKIKFEGRVLISNEIMDDSGKFYKEVTCESELAYLNDSRVGRWELYPAGLIEGAASYAETYQTINSALQKIITNHNTNVEVDKQFSLGVVEISGGVYFSTNYESSLDILISKIISDNGVVVKIRKENGIRYLDILADDPPISSTPIYLRKNLKSFKKTPDYSTFCTRLIAIGADGLTFSSINGGKNYVDNTDAILTFGTITKAIEWSEITTPQELLAKAQLRLYNILNDSYVAVEVTALDLSYIGLTPEEFDISTSYLIDNEIQNFSEVLKVVQLDLDLLAPWNSKLVFANKPIVSTSESKDVRQQVSSNRTESISQNGRLNNQITTVDEKLELYKNQNTYVHPVTHPPSIIAQDANNRFVKDTDITNWNGKATPTPTPTVYSIPLLSNWIDYGNGYGSPTYYKTIENIVHLGGLIKNGTASEWIAIGTLPPGFRPAVNRIFTTMAATATGRLLCYVDVQSTGVIIMSCPGANVWLSLDGINFPTF